MSSASESHINWCKRHPERVREYSRRCMAKESSKEKQRQWKASNPERVLAAARRWREKNARKHRASAKKWRDANRAYINMKERERCAIDPSYKLGRYLR